MNINRMGLSRRGFISGLTASLAMPRFVSRHALGDNNQAAANEKISLGAIGIGKMMYGYHLAHFLKMPEVQVVAVSDVDTTRRETGKQRVDDAYGNSDCSAYNDYREMMVRDDMDAIVCATPDHWHANVILDACQAKKDIYCEKPLTNNLMEAKMVMDAVNEAGIIFQTGSQQRASHNFRYACELVQNGRLGRIKQVVVGVGGPPEFCNLPGEDVEPGLDWDRWLGPAPMRTYSSVLSPRGMHKHFPAWRSFSQYGGGGMTDWGAHHFDIAQWGLGMDKSGPVEIVPSENPTSMSGVKFIYANGIEVVHDSQKNGVTFVGTEGELYVDRGKLKSTPVEIIQQPIGPDEIYLYQAPSGSHGGHRQDWVNCMLSRKQPNCPAETGARTIALCHLGNIAYLHNEELSGKSLRWDPQSWTFTDNDEANQWLDYPYPRREGYELTT